MAAKNPDLFTALIPVSGTSSESDVECVADARLPVWIYFDKDDANPKVVESGRKAYQMLLDAGFTPHLTEVRMNGSATKDKLDSWGFAYRDGGCIVVWQHRTGLSGNRRIFVMNELILPRCRSLVLARGLLINNFAFCKLRKNPSP